MIQRSSWSWPGELSATLFLELTDEAELRRWLPALVGVQRSAEIRIGSGDPSGVVPSIPEEDHDALLTREETTAAVHYVRFRFTPAQVDAFTEGPVRLAVNHPHYPDGVPGAVLSDATRAELSGDLR